MDNDNIKRKKSRKVSEKGYVLKAGAFKIKIGNGVFTQTFQYILLKKNVNNIQNERFLGPTNLLVHLCLTD